MTLRKILRYLQKWLRPPRSLRITKAGWKFLGLTTIVGLAAVNTSNNLLYLVFGCMLSFITASGVLSELMLRKIRLERSFLRHIFAQQATPVSMAITNRKKYVPSFSLLIEDFTQERHTEQRCYLLKIPAHSTETITYPVTFRQRGLHHPGKIRISTRFPFGFFLKSATFVEMDEDVLVYPRLEQLQPADLPQQASLLGDSWASKKGRGTEVYSIREYVHGDESTRIHWKSTAKFAKLMTREFEEEQKKKVSLILDVSFPSKNTPGTFYQDVEHAITLAASYIMHFIKQDFQLQLITPVQRTPFDRGQHHLFRLLRILALLQPSNGHSRQNLARAIQQIARADVMKILICVNTLEYASHGGFAKVVTVSSREQAREI
ncbi:hypothetical protein U27_05855 [Candidatus Vecturithrix granuli]|uniref:DUF58 domain-containing protein n=1 Tax=Vecturithrix granuli TaxID=1499967 RepID=A0A081C2S5_VECG1|nr:hypothetical protein U27_05855 [Candidatus Vecturithrix granuli]